MIYYFSIMLSSMGLVLLVTYSIFKMETMMMADYVTRADILAIFMAGILISILVSALYTLFQIVSNLSLRTKRR